MQPSVNIIELRINLLPFDTKSKKSVFYYFAHWLHRTYSIFLLQLFICLREVAHVIEIVSLLSYFEKNSSYVSSLSVCIFVAFCVRLCVAGANKVEGTMS